MSNGNQVGQWIASVFWPTRQSVVIQQRRALLRLLLVAKREGFPPTDLIANLATESGGRYGAKLRQLEAWLRGGSPLAVAVDQTAGALDESDSLAVSCGDQTGCLVETLQYLTDSPARSSASLSDAMRRSTGYLFTMSIVLFLVIGFMALFLLPSIVQIFEDLGLGLSEPMRWLLAVGSDVGWVILPIVCSLPLIIIFSFFEDFRRVVRASFLGRLIPGQKERLRSSLLRMLGLTNQIGRPMMPALIAARERRPEFHSVRSSGDQDQVDDAKVLDSLGAAGFLNFHEVEQLRILDSRSLRGWALVQLADDRVEQSGRTAGIFVRVVELLALLLIAGIVAWVAIAFLSSLSNLIQSV
ncbi:MAG: type II secretion system F family protein [Planctomycetota bacterium]